MSYPTIPTGPYSIVDRTLDNTGLVVEFLATATETNSRMKTLYSDSVIDVFVTWLILSRSRFCVIVFSNFLFCFIEFKGKSIQFVDYSWIQECRRNREILINIF